MRFLAEPSTDCFNGQGLGFDRRDLKIERIQFQTQGHKLTRCLFKEHSWKSCLFREERKMNNSKSTSGRAPSETPDSSTSNTGGGALLSWRCQGPLCHCRTACAQLGYRTGPLELAGGRTRRSATSACMPRCAEFVRRRRPRVTSLPGVAVHVRALLGRRPCAARSPRWTWMG